MCDRMTREDVIKGLELCTENGSFAECISKDCPFIGGSIDGSCIEMLMRNAIALLKAQEPRVMTLDELSEKTDVWFESLVYDTIEPALSSGSYDDGTVGLMTLEEELFYMDEADYGTKWRCWTSRPTDEQRQAVKWE